MRVYEPKRGGNLDLRGPVASGAIVYRKNRVIREFDYARDAVAYAQRCHDLDLGIGHLKIVNPATR